MFSSGASSTLREKFCFHNFHNENISLFVSDLLRRSGPGLGVDRTSTTSLVRNIIGRHHWPGWPLSTHRNKLEVSPVQCGPLSLVEIQRGSVIIGREPPSVAPLVSLMP